jgi:predicted DNA-binding transcriptional regulator AlpA
MITQKELAKIKGISYELLRHHLKKPDAPKGEKYGRMTLYDPAEIEHWQPSRRKTLPRPTNDEAVG